MFGLTVLIGDSCIARQPTKETIETLYEVTDCPILNVKTRMSEKLNTNPTIRNASDLPSRQRHSPSYQARNKISSGLLTSIIPSSAYAPDPFSPTPSSLDLEDLEDDDSIEPIDEQEIYGILTSYTS